MLNNRYTILLWLRAAWFFGARKGGRKMGGFLAAPAQSIPQVLDELMDLMDLIKSLQQIEVNPMVHHH